MNTIATRSAAAGAIASLSNLKSGLQNVASTIVTPGGTPILRMLKDGGWVYGAENVDVEDGSLWAVNIYTLMHGWVSWTDHKGRPNEIVGEVMVPMTSPIPSQTELRDTGWEWDQQLSVEMRCMNGTDAGETVVYKVTSVGGMNAVKTLIAAIMKQLDTDPDRPVPVVRLDNDTYMHKTHGKVYVPIIEADRWVALTDDAPEMGEPEAQPKAEPEKPARQRASRAAPSVPASEKPAAEPQQTVAVTDADRRAALLAQLAELEGGEPEGGAEPPFEGGQPVADAPRRRRRA